MSDPLIFSVSFLEIQPPEVATNISLLDWVCKSMVMMLEFRNTALVIT
jgi:hypothetical protein